MFYFYRILVQKWGNIVGADAHIRPFGASIDEVGGHPGRVSLLQKYVQGRKDYVQNAKCKMQSAK